METHPSLTAGPIDEQDAFWCWAHTTAVLFDDHGPSVTSYLRTMAHDWRAVLAKYEHEPMTDPEIRGQCTARARAMLHAYSDALRVLEQATEAADRLTARYDDEHAS